MNPQTRFSLFSEKELHSHSYEHMFISTKADRLIFSQDFRP